MLCWSCGPRKWYDSAVCLESVLLVGRFSGQIGLVLNDVCGFLGSLVAITVDNAYASLSASHIHWPYVYFTTKVDMTENIKYSIKYKNKMQTTDY